MSKADFEKFLELKQTQHDTFVEDYNNTPRQRKDNYVEWVSGIISQIKSWMAPITYHEHVTVEDEEKTITEPPIGDYIVSSLTITIYDCKIQIDPVGSIVLYAEGRIDIKSNYTRNDWCLVFKGFKAPFETTLTKTIPYVKERKELPFNEDTFFDVLTEIGMEDLDYEEPNHE